MTKFYLYARRYLTVLFLLGSLVAFGQGRTVTGKVTGADDGLPIPGVNVLEKGTSNGTVTDADGNFSISVGDNATLVFSFVGYVSQEVSVGSQSSFNVTMQSDVTALSEVVVTGYGSQDKKEITSSVVAVNEKDFNVGNINDPSQLLAGKVAGLSIYNRDGNPNSNSVIRLRGISTIGANASPLVVIDGVIGASLDNVDPNDIESINVLKDGSAAAIYGSRASSGVILVTTKRGSKRGSGVSIDYNGQIAASTAFRQVPNMSGDQYVAAGGNDLLSRTDWVDEVTRTGISNVHNLSISGGTQNTQFRMSTNFRGIDGILEKSGFDQINTRANLTHNALDNRLKVDLNMAFTTRKSNFSFNEALRYAVLFNPTAPVRFSNGEFYQAILFDNFNPVAILEQNVNEGKRKNLNYNAMVSYEILNGLSATVNFGQQFESNFNGEYYSRNSLFRGLNRGGLARRYTSDREFTLFEAYGTYNKSFKNVDLTVTGGYSFQQEQFEDLFIALGNFPNDELGYNALENSGDRLSGIATLVDVNSSRTPKEQITAQFARVNLTIDKGIFLNASVRREGSTKLGSDSRYGVFPAAGVGVDVLRYADLGSVSALKVRFGYGVTGSLPIQSGLAQEFYQYNLAGGGSITKTRAANPDLKWEEKAEMNLGFDFGIGSKLTGTLDLYSRNISDFILEAITEVILVGAGTQFQNAGRLKTQGIELALNYNSITLGQVVWTPGIVVSSYSTKLEDFLTTKLMVANLGAPGQNDTQLVRVKVGEKIGQIWGPVFDGVEGNGAPRFRDLNGDGQVLSNPGSALADNGDFQELGSGLPTMEYGWTNQLTFKNWDLNAFFRGAVGHSLVNSFRAFYEPIDPGAINSYNRITTDKAVPGLTAAQFSSLYVEKASFFKLDNITLGYNFNTTSGAFKRARVYFNVQNAFMITDYTGVNPEPALQDFGDPDNGNFGATQPNVLAPGIDRRNSYFNSRTFTFGVNLGF